MLAAYTKLQNAEKVKQFLLKKGLINADYLPVKEMGYIYFPLLGKVKILATFPTAKIVNVKFSFPKREKPLTVDELFKDKLTKKELKLLPRSQEIMGKIMILEVPEELENKEKLIAEAYLKVNKNVETVVKKDKIHSGIYRIRTVKVLAGKRTKETIHHENGVKIKLHLEKTYFSARSANERLRIAQQVKKGENILVMFSGAGPYPLVIAKNSPAKKIWGVEINPHAHLYAVDNIQSNNLSNKISLLEGDVRQIVPDLRKKFDRIVMPLPRTGEEFLNLALSKSKNGTKIHLYAFLHEREIAAEARKIKKICKQLDYIISITHIVKCGQFSPGVFRISFDLKVLGKKNEK